MRDVSQFHLAWVNIYIGCGKPSICRSCSKRETMGVPLLFVCLPQEQVVEFFMSCIRGPLLIHVWQVFLYFGILGRLHLVCKSGL